MNMRKTILTTLTALCLAMAASAQQPLLKTHVETGDVEGSPDGTDLAIYKAIPYAAPPVGDLRWKAPQPAKPWEGTLKADNFGPLPPQPTRPGRTADMMSEDCLYLGIATPATSASQRLPVMVWIHGGGFQTEHYGGDLWTALARRGVVVVSIEYRTGALGFMAHPELAKESKGGHTGNYGLLDQIFALEWVQRNIKHFGGDASNVTIFGESAGAISCSILAGSPLAKGLFHRVISQSGGSFGPWQDKARTLAANASQKGAEQQGLAFQKHLKKKSLKQLRQMSAQQLCGNDVGFGGFWPCVDGYVITDDLYRNYERGEYNDVPAIIMTNSDEGALFTREMAPEDFQKAAKATFGDKADEALKLYPANTSEEAYFANGDLFRDMGFAWPSFAWASLQSQTGKAPVYAAYLAQPSELSIIGDKKRHGVSHADDILYLNGAFLSQPDKYPTEAALAEMIQQYWVNFAKTGNPNAKGLPYWPAFDKDKTTTMQFSNGASLIDVPNRAQIDFIDRFFAEQRKKTEGERKVLSVEGGGTGPFKALMKEEASLPAHTVFVPKDLAAFSASKPLPVLVWGNGACQNSPWEHYKFLNEIASHGYIVLATGYLPLEEKAFEGPMSTTQQQIESIDWAIAQNKDKKSPYYQKIDVSNICVAGMSCGGLQTLFNCADKRIKTLMICNSGLFNQQNAHQAVGGMPMPPKEKLKEIHSPIIYILGGKEDIAYENGMDDFHRISHVPACAINYPVGHGGTYREAHGGEFTIPALAWLDWQLKGDKEAAKMFTGSDPALLKRKGWTLEKNSLF